MSGGVLVHRPSSGALVDRRRLRRRAARRPREVLRHVEGDRPAPAARPASTRRRRPGRSSSSRRRTAAGRRASPARPRSCCSRSRRRCRTPTSPTTVAGVGAGGGEPIPPDGAVLMAAGIGGAQAAGRGAGRHAVTLRLILQPAWTGVVVGTRRRARCSYATARRSSARSRTSRTTRSPRASPRAAVGQLADGRIVLVAVDGSQPGYSVGLTSFELAQTMQRLGAVTASALESGRLGDGCVRRRSCSTGRASPPASAPSRRRCSSSTSASTPPQPPLPLLTGEPARAVEPLRYKIVRPSTVTAQLIGPDGVPRVARGRHRARARHRIRSPSTALRRRGDVALERLGDRRPRARRRRSSGRSGTTRRCKRARRRRVSRRGSATIRFTLARSAAACGFASRRRAASSSATLPAATLQPGAQWLVWDGRLPHGTRAYAGTYVAHLTVDELRRHVRPHRSVRLQTRSLESPPVTSWLAHYGVFAVFVLMVDRRGLPGGERARDGLRRRARLRCARRTASTCSGWHATGLGAYLAVVARRRRSATSSARSSAGGSATAAAGRSSSATGAGST